MIGGVWGAEVGADNGNWGSRLVGECWGSIAGESWLSVGDGSWGNRLVSKSWGSVAGVSWSRLDNGGLSISEGLDNWGSLDNGSWCRSVNSGVESVDGIGSVGDSTDGTIGLNQRVLSLHDISVTRFGGGLGVSGQSVRDRVSVVVLWVSIEWLWLGDDGLGVNWSGDGLLDDGLKRGSYTSEPIFNLT